MSTFFTFLKRTFFAGLLFFGLAFFVSNANASFYYFNDFESCAVGDFYNCDNDWASYDFDSSRIYSDANLAYSGSNYLADKKGNIYTFSTPLEEGSFEFMVYINTAGNVGFYLNAGTAGTLSTGLYSNLGVVSSYCSTNQFYTRDLTDTDGWNTLPPETICRTDVWQKWSIQWKNEGGRMYTRVGHNDFFTDWSIRPLGWETIKEVRILVSGDYDLTQAFLDDIKIVSPLEAPPQPYLWSNWCGSDAGTMISTTPTNLCEVGTAGEVSFDGSKWSWDCIDGVVSQSCRAYLATTEPVNGTCGVWDGETFDIWPPATELCELKASLVVPSMVETLNGYSWTCAGINGGTSSQCSGNKTDVPLMPELPAGSIDDCSGLGLLEGLVCEIGNTLKTIFLPSSEKIEELNQTINKMSGKFPFSYISKATDTFNEVKNNINETSELQLSIMGSETSTIDFSTISFLGYIKMLSTILIILAFSFWLVRFIRNIF